MFTINEIKAAHSKVKSGADFPGYVKEIKALSVKSYATYVSDGHTVYTSTGNQTIQTDAKYPSIEIAPVDDVENFRHSLKIHQGGKTDYLTFCRDAAAAGVEKWVVDTTAMTCTYYSLAAQEMLVEYIPQS